MRGTVTEEGVTSRADAERDLKDFPLLQTRAVSALKARSRTVRVLLSGSPAFRLLMLGSSISMLGTRISTVAFPMLVLHLSNSPLIAGLIAFCAIAPSVLIYVPAGVLVDRWNPRRVMLVSESLRGVTVISVVIALMVTKTHVSIRYLIGAMVAEEILEIFSTLADRRYMNRVIERDKIVSQQASIEVRTHAVVLAGRPVGPFLFSIDPFLPFLADAASFVASVTSLLLVRRIDEPQQEMRPLRFSEVASDIRRGFSWLLNDRRAWITVLLMAGTSMIAQALILMFLDEAHSRQLSTVEIGIVLAASGAGGAVGSFGVKFLPTAVRSSWLAFQLIAWSVALFFLWVTGGQSVYFSAVTMFIIGLTGAIGNVEFGTYLVRNVEDSMIAKVVGVSQMLAIGAASLGPVLGGYAVQRFQVRGATLILLGVVTLLAFFSLLLPDLPKQLIHRSREIKELIGGHVRPLSAHPRSFSPIPDPSSEARAGRQDSKPDKDQQVIVGSDPIPY